MTRRFPRRNPLLSASVLLLASALIAPLAFLSGDDPPAPTAAQVAAADPDFLIQGEYVGVLEREGEPEMFGLQVVALGGGQFEAAGFRGGLPGAGWDKGAKLRFAGRRGGEGAVLAAKDGPGALRLTVAPAGSGGGDLAHLLVHGERDRVIGRLERVIRKSPTLGEKPPPGAIVLFDGNSSESFRTAKDAPAKMSGDRLLRLDRGSGGLFTRRAHGSCRLHLEFRLPFEPARRGQDRANGGCYLQGRYEVQILDSFGLEGKENECGGVYSSGKDPEVNMAFPPMSWQTFDLEFTVAAHDAAGKKTASARLSVWHNGVQVYRDLPIDHATTAAPSPEGQQPLPLYLQDHGHEVFFRNLWLVER